MKLQLVTPEDDQANKKNARKPDPRGWMMLSRSLVGAFHNEKMDEERDIANGYDG